LTSHLKSKFAIILNKMKTIGFNQSCGGQDLTTLKGLYIKSKAGSKKACYFLFNKFGGASKMKKAISGCLVALGFLACKPI